MAIAQQLHKDILILVPTWVFPDAAHQVEQAVMNGSRLTSTNAQC